MEPTPLTSREDLADLFAEKGYTRGVEVGTAEGEFAETLCQRIPNLRLTCVDPWRRLPGYRGMQAADLEDCYRQARERLEPYGVELLRMTSLDAAEKIPDHALDFVYIDANHELPWIMDDLCAWSKKVRPGGMVSGHDYHGMNDRCHVKLALDCFAAAYHIHPVILGDRYHSWFYVKG